MTSDELKQNLANHYTTEYWLKQIAIQLAVMNEREQKILELSNLHKYIPVPEIREIKPSEIPLK